MPYFLKGSVLWEGLAIKGLAIKGLVFNSKGLIGQVEDEKGLGVAGPEELVDYLWCCLYDLRSFGQ